MVLRPLGGLQSTLNRARPLLTIDSGKESKAGGTSMSPQLTGLRRCSAAIDEPSGGRANQGEILEGLRHRLEVLDAGLEE